MRSTQMVVASSCAALLAVLAAGIVLNAGSVGSSTGATGCRSAPLGGLALLMLAGAMIEIARISFDLSTRGGRMIIDIRRSIVPGVLAGLIVLATVPGVLGCEVAGVIGARGVLGEALVGAPGLALAAAGSILLGGGLASILRVEGSQLGRSSVSDLSPIDPLERLIDDADSAAHHDTATRFQGVDPS